MSHGDKKKHGVAYGDLLSAARNWANYKNGTVEGVFTYYHAADEPAFGVAKVRYADGSKDCPQWHPEPRSDGRRLWVSGGISGRRPLYRLPPLLAIGTEVPVLHFEGERKADDVASLGFPATTTSSMGAGNAAQTDFGPLGGRDVVLFPDNDDEGRKYANDVARLAYAAGARTVSIAELPGLPAGGDVVDFIARRRSEGATDEQIAVELSDAIHTARLCPPPASAVPADALPLEEERDPFPVAVLPPAMRDFVVEGAAAQGVDAGFWGVPLPAILAGCIGATRRVRITADWQEPAVTWSAVIAPSGAGKSPPLRALLEPLRQHDYALHLRNNLAMRAYDEAKATRAKGTPDPERPPILAATIDDTTLEAVATRLVDNPRGLALVVDELAGWVRSFDRYRKNSGGDAQRWLSIHGAVDFPVDRKTTTNGPARIYVRRPCVSIAGTLQPSIARKYLGDPEAVSCGLAARVLIAAPPLTVAVWTEREIPRGVHDAYGRVIRSLLDLRLDAEGNAGLLRLDPDARQMFIEFYNQNGQATFEAASGGDESLAAALSKLRGYAPRLALVLALARAAEDGVAEMLATVDAESMSAGVTLAHWFEGEARRIYEEWESDDAADLVASDQNALSCLQDRLAKIIAEKGPQSMRELHAATGRNVPGQMLRAALAAMAASGVLTSTKVVGDHGGRPRETWGVCSPP